MMLSNGERRSGTRIRSVSRAAAILELIASDPSGARATDVAAALELPLPTAYHLLNTLTADGLLTKLKDRRYQLGPKIGLFAEAFAAQLSTPEPLPTYGIADSTRARNERSRASRRCATHRSGSSADGATSSSRP
jgi:hypothetical protein